MSFIGSVFGGIASAIGSVLGIAGNITSGIGGTIGEIVSNVASIASSVIGTIRSAVGTAFTAITGFTGNVINGIGGFVKSTSNFIDAFITPVKHFVSEITDFVNRINTNFVQPIRDVVSTTYNAIRNFATALHTDLHNGILGLLSIPGDLANALTSVDAQFQRATEALGGQQKQIVQNDLVPGLKSTIGDQISEFSRAYNETLGPAVSQLGHYHVETLYDQQQTKDLAAWAAEVMTDNGKIGGWYGTIWKILTDLLTLMSYVNSEKSAELELVRQASQATELPARLPLAEIIRAYYRGTAPFEQLKAEAAYHGLSNDRLGVLVENASWLPGGRELVEMLYRGAVTQADADRIAAQIGYTGDGWKALQEAALTPPDARQVIEATQRRAATQNGWLTASIGGATPPEVISAARIASGNANRADAEWVNHWRIPGPEFWFTAWRRGLAKEEDMLSAAQAEGVPPEAANMLAGIFARPIELWMIPDMVGSGIMTEQQGIDYLQYIGMDAQSSKLIMDYGLAKLKAPAGTQAAMLADISASQAKKMYDAKIIGATEYQQILVDHGYGATAAELTVALAVQEEAITERTNTAKGLVEEYKAGQITKDVAVAQLYTLGYTTPEVDKYANEMKAAASAKAKFPSEAQLNDMLRYGVISASEWRDGMSVIGYADAWIPYLYGLEVAKHGEPPKPQ